MLVLLHSIVAFSIFRRDSHKPDFNATETNQEEHSRVPKCGPSRSIARRRRVPSLLNSTRSTTLNSDIRDDDDDCGLQVFHQSTVIGIEHNNNGSQRGKRRTLMLLNRLFFMNVGSDLLSLYDSQRSKTTRKSHRVATVSPAHGSGNSARSTTNSTLSFSNS